MESTLGLVLVSERLRIVPVSAEYVPDIFREFTEEIIAYVFPPMSASEAELLGVVAAARGDMERGTEYWGIVTDRATGEFLGSTGCHGLADPQPELGIWIKKSAHGRGYGYEAVEACVAYLASLGRYARARYPVDERNLPSRRIAEKLGGVPLDGIVEKIAERPRRELRIVTYVIPLDRTAYP